MRGVYISAILPPDHLVTGPKAEELLGKELRASDGVGDAAGDVAAHRDSVVQRLSRQPGLHPRVDRVSPDAAGVDDLIVRAVVISNLRQLDTQHKGRPPMTGGRHPRDARGQVRHGGVALRWETPPRRRFSRGLSTRGPHRRR